MFFDNSGRRWTKMNFFSDRLYDLLVLIILKQYWQRDTHRHKLNAYVSFTGVSNEIFTEYEILWWLVKPPNSLFFHRLQSPNHRQVKIIRRKPSNRCSFRFLMKCWWMHIQEAHFHHVRSLVTWSRSPWNQKICQGKEKEKKKSFAG